MDDLFKYVTEEDEVLLHSFKNNSKMLKDEGTRQYLIPGSAGGIFLILIGLLCHAMFSDGTVKVVCKCVSFLGVLLLFSSIVFFAVFLRASRAAQATELHVTSRNIIWIESGRYAKLPLSDITGARTERSGRYSALFFDLSALEAEYLVLEYRGADMKIPYVEDPGTAKDKINALLG